MPRNFTVWPSHRGRIATLLGAVIIILATAPLTGCDPKPPVQNTVASDWMAQNDPPSKVAVVFVHGLFGTTTGTWKNDNGATFFDLLKQDPDLGGKVDIFAFGFTSNMFRSGSLNIVEAANAFDQVLTRKRVWNYESIVLVGHSMGGLIAMRTLINHPEKRKRVPLLLLYSSPQEGSQIAAMAKHVTNNEALRQLIPADGNDFLQILDDEWSRIPERERPAVVCAYEKAGVGGAVMIVGRSSATRYCGEERIAIGGSDHISIVKPANRDSMAYVVLANALERYVLGTDFSPRLSMPDFTHDGDRLFYTLSDPQQSGSARIINDSPRQISFSIVRPSNPKLIVSPTETPKTIGPGQTQYLGFDLLYRGRSDPEYAFTIHAPPLNDRTVVVRVPDYQSIQAQQFASIQAMTQAISGFLASDENVTQLNLLPLEAQRERIVEVARGAVTKISPKLSSPVSWVLTADGLSSAGLPDLATTALRKVEAESPQTARSTTVQVLAKAISIESGARVLLDTPQLEIAPEALSSFKGGQAFMDSDNLNQWRRLSERMLDVPALRQESMMLKGDVLRHGGDFGNAEQAYLSAQRIKGTPEINRRIEEMQKMQNDAAP